MLIADTQNHRIRRIEPVPLLLDHLQCFEAHDSTRFDAIVAFAGVEPFLDAPVKTYSSGMYVRLGFAVAPVIMAYLIKAYSWRSAFVITGVASGFRPP